MAKRRSPNYPAVSLRDSIEDMKKIHAKDGRNKVSREAAAVHLGYNGLNGRSLRKLGALKAYGLLDGRGDDLRVSEDAVEIIAEPVSSDARQKIISKCAFQPNLFAQLREQFEGSPSEANLRTFLIKKEFTDDAARIVTAVYLDTLDLVDKEGVGYNITVNEEESDDAPNDDGDPTAQFSGSHSGSKGTSNMNQFKVLVDGDRLQITGTNVDFAGIDLLKETLDKYKDILKMLEPTKDQSEA